MNTVGAKKKKKKSGTAQPVPVSKGEVWWVENLSFSGNPGSKSRPVLVLHDCGDGMVEVMEITSQPSADIPESRIEEYISAGLDHESYIKLQPRRISCRKLSRKMGRLTDSDLENVH